MEKAIRDSAANAYNELCAAVTTAHVKPESVRINTVVRLNKGRDRNEPVYVVHSRAMANVVSYADAGVIEDQLDDEPKYGKHWNQRRTNDRV